MYTTSNITVDTNKKKFEASMSILVSHLFLGNADDAFRLANVIRESLNIENAGSGGKIAAGYYRLLTFVMRECRKGDDVCIRLAKIVETSL